MSRAAARRAARFGLPFYPPQHQPELEAFYHEELERQGKQGFYLHPGAGNAMAPLAPRATRAPLMMVWRWRSWSIALRLSKS